MITDYEAVVADLESYILSKPSHGQRDLLTKLSELRSAHRVREGLLDRSLRILGVRVTKEPLLSLVDREPSDDDPAGVAAMEPDDDHRSRKDDDADHRDTRPARSA